MTVLYLIIFNSSSVKDARLLRIDQYVFQMNSSLLYCCVQYVLLRCVVCNTIMCYSAPTKFRDRNTRKLFNARHVGLLFSITLFDTEIGIIILIRIQHCVTQTITDVITERDIVLNYTRGSQIHILISLFYKSAYREQFSIMPFARFSNVLRWNYFEHKRFHTKYKDV